ncbi:hypothetical protein KSB_41870 [Ktedonobacter robiniae]|uniref:Uncharacterized protein n=1 Tax=Ktedonobacter robiniae TaxID=2778365 RepID=A0ABQ3USZ4_9CHLR|nr:hypothetical protein KSB_41870 [Ktedonobacter robiniae]
MSIENSPPKSLDYRLYSTVYALDRKETRAFEEEAGPAREAPKHFQIGDTDRDNK